VSAGRADHQLSKVREAKQILSNGSTMDAMFKEKAIN
jgi:hypothetical protein